MKEEKSMKHWLKRKVTFTQALLVAFLITGGIGFAANLASNETNIQIGKGATLQNIQEGNGAVVIGENAKIDSYVNQPGSIAIGKNAFSETMVGRQEKVLGFKQSTYNKFGLGSIPNQPEKVVGTVTLGDNTYARSGGVMIGSHNYRGKLGDVEINTDTVENRRKYGLGVLATTLGANSFTNGAFANTTGAYSIISGKYDGNDSNIEYVAQNFGAIISGSLNSIESATSSNKYSGIANAIVGTANRTQNSNASLIFGAGNEITNSIADVKMPVDLNGFSQLSSAKELSDKLREAVKTSESGGATLAIGGGNKADYTIASQLIGVNNTLTGKSGKESKYALLNGYKNTATNVENTYVTGTENTVTESESVSVIGKGNKITNSDRQNVFGDNNTIENRDAPTVSGYDGKTKRNGTFDLVVGMGNKITGNDTYMTGKESLTVIGNNNESVNPSSGIVIGDNQKFGAIKNTVVIGTINKPEEDIVQKHNSVVVGYNARSGTKTGGGVNVAVGYGAEALSWAGTVVGTGSRIDKSEEMFNGTLASIYGAYNKIDFGNKEESDGVANSVVGAVNATKDASGALVFGSGNKITNSVGKEIEALKSIMGDQRLFALSYYAQGDSYSEDFLDKMGEYLASSGGSIFAIGSANRADYALRSQLFGVGNSLNGAEGKESMHNTLSGYKNIGKNVNYVSMIGTGNKVSDSTTDVIIGDYHEVTGGKNNVIVGSMASKEETVKKELKLSYDGNTQTIPYEEIEHVPVKKHTANISNAVMIGYNTDVQKDGGIALGSESVADRDKGKVGYDALNEKHDEDTTGTWKSTAAALSIGEKDKITRQITGVAAGSEDTDAVNVAQLKALNNKVDKNTIHYVSIKSDEQGVDSNYLNDGAKGKDSIVVGIHSTSSGVNSAVFGNHVKLTGEKNGRNNSIVAGHHIEADGTHNAIFATDYRNYDHKTTHVAGEQNTVLGVGNLVGWTAEKDSSDPTKWVYKKIGNRGSDQNVAVGMLNTANGGSIVVGTSSTSESLGSSFGHGNTIIGMDNDGGQRGLALGNDLKVKGEEAVAIGTESEATSDLDYCCR